MLYLQVESMLRIKLRPIEEVRWDLKRILDKGPKVVSLHIETPLAKEVKSMVAGCFELLVAELLSHKLRLGDITYDGFSLLLFNC